MVEMFDRTDFHKKFSKWNVFLSVEDAVRVASSEIKRSAASNIIHIQSNSI